MPDRALRSCAEPGCRVLVREGRCPEHQRTLRREENAARPEGYGRRYGHAWKQIRLRHLRREPLCRSCRERGVLAPATEVDHIVPIAAGGSNLDENLQSLCKPCHSSKTLGEIRARSLGGRR